MDNDNTACSHGDIRTSISRFSLEARQANQALVVVLGTDHSLTDDDLAEIPRLPRHRGPERAIPDYAPSRSVDLLSVTAKKRRYHAGRTYSSAAGGAPADVRVLENFCYLRSGSDHISFQLVATRRKPLAT